MFYVYLLKSGKSGRWYIGQTSNLKSRLTEHNSQRNQSTKHDCPWELVYYEAYRTRSLALGREKQLKRFAKSFSMLKKRIGL